MNLHGQIMNLPHGPLPDVDGTSHALAYKTGHRDALHAAAELALAADAEIERLRDARAGPTEEMLRAGQEALFEVFPAHTIEEREEVAREVWTVMAALVTRPAKPNAVYSNASNGQLADPAGGPNVFSADR
jgi:hypothetical protein